MLMSLKTAGWVAKNIDRDQTLHSALGIHHLQVSLSKILGKYGIHLLYHDLGCTMPKHVFGHMQTAKAQISLPIHSLIRAFTVC